MKTIAFFNAAGGAGTTSLVYHLAWMLDELGLKTVAIDLDPQADLTAMFLTPEEIETKKMAAPWSVSEPRFMEFSRNLRLVPGDLNMAALEDRLAARWLRFVEGAPSLAAPLQPLDTLIETASALLEPDAALLDLGPNLTAINRAALLLSDMLVIPLSPNLKSIEGLEALKPSLDQWSVEWIARGGTRAVETIGFAEIRQGWVPRWREVVLPDWWKDAVRLGTLPHYPTLVGMATDARKPMFDLKPGDGAQGGILEAVFICRAAYEDFANAIIARLNAPGHDPARPHPAPAASTP